MKKGVAIIAGVVVVAAGAWLGGTWYTGKRLESEEAAQIQDLNAKLAEAVPGYQAKLQRVSYDRGFFTTRARYGLTMQAPQAAPGEDPIVLKPGMVEIDTLIQHGPFPGGALARGDLLPRAAFVHAELVQTEALKPLFAATQGKAPLWSDSVVHYNGDSTGTGGLAAARVEHQGTTLVFGGAAMEGEYRRAEEGIKGTMRIDSLSIENPTDEELNKIAINGVDMHVDTRLGKFGVSVGDTSMKVKRLDIQGPADQVSAALDDLAYTLKIGENDTTINGEAVYSVGKLSVGSTDMGNGQITIKLANLEGNATRKLARTYTDLVNAMMAQSTGGETDDAAAAELMKRSVSDVRDLLVAGPTLTVDPVLWKTDEGESRLTYTLALQPPKDADAPVQELVRQAIKSMQAHVVVSKPMAQDLLARVLVATQGVAPDEAATRAADEIQTSTGMAEMMGIVRSDGDNMRIDLVYDGAKATLNGQEIPVDSLLSSIAGPEGMDGDDADLGMPESASGESGGADSSTLHMLTNDTIGDLITAAGYEYEARTDEYGEPEMEVKPADSGATGINVFFTSCDVDDGCENAMLRAVYEPIKPEPLKLINDWNRGNRWARAYIDEDNRPTLEMDINAYGGIGRDGVEAFVQTFFDTVPQFAETLNTARKSK